MILLITEGTNNQKVAITYLAIGIDTQVTHHVITKYSKCNTFQVIIDFVHDFINFIALKII